ncbi:MAG: IS4 family transposase [Polyangiaceae bacterium]
MAQGDIRALGKEVAAGNFEDARLTRRLERIVERVAENPSLSLPKAMSVAELEGAYRFFSNARVVPGRILAPHIEATRRRCEALGRVLILHDTTDFSYRPDGEREGLGRCIASKQTFFAHFSLALSADGLRRPLGVVGLKTWARGDSPKGGERARWLAQANVVREALGPNVRRVHVMDREADDFEVLSGMAAMGEGFIVRAKHNRWLDLVEGEERTRLREVVSRTEVAVQREAALTRRHAPRSPTKAKIHPARKARLTQLSLSVTRVTLPCTGCAQKAGNLGEPLTLNVVRAWEPDPPEGEVAVEWLLLTNEPVETTEALEACVDAYRARWTIEEYFKALKTGCSFELRQLHDYEGLVNALAVFATVAYHVLLIRSEARRAPDAEPLLIITPEQIEVLRVLGRRPLPEAPTNRDIMLAVAALGGHIKYAPDPGWQTLAFGYNKLTTLTEGWMAAKLQPPCDQR